MDFGFTLKLEHDPARTLDLTRRAEANGFTHGWVFDSHVLWRDPYPLLTLMVGATERMRLGTCVTNPGTREPSVTASALAALNEISGGRMNLGIGRGDSARRVLGKPPTTMKTLEEAITVIRDLVEGRSVTYEGTELQLTWAGRWQLPVWVAGYGPMALAMTGRVADGLILQLADPDLIRWFVSQLRDAEAAAGRPPGSIEVQAAAPAHVGPRDLGQDRTRWFPALVSNHVVDLVTKYPREQLPEALTGYVTEREGYDYLHHAEVGSANAAFVGDEVTDRFCILGEPAEHVAKLQELAEAGVNQFNMYLMNGDEEEQLDRYGREVVPALQETMSARQGGA
ncbi:MAG TPA: TIGR03842 family LLM class F420-dependent oxidoreductase [Pleomorphomonadaceae bacterium]|nr:TIGR03842 family LLM class F420-dependent oxidoreductase [Pleomorphomonadaceae bacterium]